MTTEWTDAGLARLLNDVKKRDGMEQIKDGGQTAFPVWELNGHGNAEMTDFGLTARQYAAIHLREPNSGVQWLDDMIRKTMRDEFAAKAMQGLVAGSGPEAEYQEAVVASSAYTMADAMLAAREAMP